MDFVSQAYAQTQAWSTINGSCVSDGVATIQGIGCLMANVLSVALTLLGLTGFVMIIIAAFSMLLSGGNSQAMEKSKNTLTFAIVGIILALSSFIIINLIASFTGIDIIKNLSIPNSDKDWTSPSTTTSSDDSSSTEKTRVSTPEDPCINNGGYCAENIQNGTSGLKCSLYCCNSYHLSPAGVGICGPSSVSGDPNISVKFPNGTFCTENVTADSTLPNCKTYCQNGYHAVSGGGYKCGPN